MPRKTDRKVLAPGILRRDTARAQPVPYPTDRYQPAAIKYGWRPIYQEENSLTSLLSTFCIIFPCLLWKCKTEAKIRSWGASAAGVWGEGREEMLEGRIRRTAAWGPFLSCHRHQSGKEIQGQGDGGGKLLVPPIIAPAENPWGFFGFPKNALTYFSKCCLLIHQNTFLMNCSQVFCNYPIQSFSFYWENYHLWLHA